MVYISRLKLKNFKSFKTAEIPLPKTYICIAGGNGCGKCVDGDSEVIIADGTREKIRTLVDQAISQGYYEQIDDGIIAKMERPVEIVSLNIETLKLERKPVYAFVKRTAPKKMMKIETRSGTEIVATEYHPLFILKNNKVQAVRADELKVGTRVAAPRKIPTNNKILVFEEFINIFEMEDFIYVPYEEKIAKAMNQIKGNRTWEELEKALSSHDKGLSSYEASKQAIEFRLLVRLLRFGGLTNLEITQLVSHVKGRRNITMNIPWTNSVELCRFVGYLLAEGSISKTNTQVRFTNGDLEIIDDFVKISKKIFGLEAKVCKYKEGSYDVIINCSPLRKLLVELGMHPEGAGKKFISEILIKHSNKDELAEILNGIYCGDGYVSDRSIELTLKSKQLIEDIRTIFLLLEIPSRYKKITKRETKTGFVGEYHKLSIFESDNVRKFQELVSLVHKEKRERIAKIALKKSNPNIDLIETENLIGDLARKLELKPGKFTEEVPRFKSYCRKECTPSRSGLAIVLNQILKPAYEQKTIEIEEIETLEKIVNSDIFWDEIVSIERIEPKEEWVYDLSIEGNHNFIANGVIVHNSNICDAIRFVLGETSLRNLRARKVKDLIHNDSKSAEVTLSFLDDQGQTHEVKRAIAEDGKVIYRLNGERVTRTSVVETLKKFGFDESGRNTVAQGEVARIINMNGKERRGIIDSVAGIADFEQKKKEAMTELGVVDTRIKDSNLVLGERRAFVEELGREKEVALKFVDTKKRLVDSKATLLKFEIEKAEKDLKDAAVKDDEITRIKDVKNKEILAIEEEIKKVEAKRDEISKELQSKRDTHQLIRKIEELKASIGAKEQQIADKKENVEKVKAEIVKIGWEITGEKNVIEDIKKEMENLKIDLRISESKLKEIGGEIEDKKVKKAREVLDVIETEFLKVKEKLIQIEAQIKSKQDLLEAKKSELENVPGAEGESGDNKEGVKNAQIIEKQISELFRKTKEINTQISEIDREMLELREKLAVFKVRTNPQIGNPAIALIKEMKNKGEMGIFGIVSDLIDSEPEYAAAIEAAAGARLMYVVVDSVDTATKVIEKLKAARVGRASFIPIDSIRVPPLASAKGFSSILNVISTKNEVSRAIEYVFSDTLLINKVEDAKVVGIGNARMVTKEGEIFERSGIVSGGKSEGGILGSNQLRKLEDEAAALKNSKESLISELYSIREEETRLRAEKAQIEIKLKTQEMKNSLIGQSSQRRNKLLEEVSQIEKSLEENQKTFNETKQAYEEHLQKTNKAREELAAVEELSRKENQDSSNLRAELSAKVSSIRATIEGRNKEIEIRMKEIGAKTAKNAELEESVKSESRAIITVKTQFENEKIDLNRFQEEMGEKSVEIEALFNKLKEFDAEFAKFGKEVGHRRIELEKTSKEMNQVEIKRATATQRLQDLMVEFGGFKEATILDEPIEEIRKKVAESEATMNSLGPVNMASIEMYDKKLAEISEVVEKIDTLNKEREAIISMINEIDEKKKEAFFETFKSVSDHFTSMFKYVDIGEGHLSLDKPNDPFESGLFLKIRRNNKEYNLEAFSGGEKTIVAMMFIFALQFFKPSPFYILDEVDAALDKQNSKRLSELVAQMAKDSQFIVVSHNDTVMAGSETVIGVTKTGGVSRAVGVKLKASEQVASS